MTKANSKITVPKLRFPGFKGEWEVKRLGEVIKSIVPPRKIPTMQYDDTGLFPIVDQSKSQIAGWTNDKASVIDKGFPLIIFGDHTCILKITHRPFAQGADGIKIFSTLSSLITVYLYQYLQVNPLNSDKYTRHFALLKESEIFYPDKREQTKIADCLSSLDELITNEQQKLDLLKQHKKSLMQNLFPAEGKTVPKLRFPGFKDAWEEKRLGDYLIQKPEYGMNAPAVPYSDKLPTYIRITDISEAGHFHASGKVSVDKPIVEEDYLSEGDIVLARTGASVGKSYKFRNKDGKLVFAGFLIKVRPNEKKLNSELLFQFLATSQYWKWVSFISARSGQPGINGNEYSSMPICLPRTKKEQTKIADCLASLDNLITTEQQKLDAYKQHKKSLMQQLFPASEVRGEKWKI